MISKFNNTFWCGFVFSTSTDIQTVLLQALHMLQSVMRLSGISGNWGSTHQQNAFCEWYPLDNHTRRILRGVQAEFIQDESDRLNTSYDLILCRSTIFLSNLITAFLTKHFKFFAQKLNKQYRLNTVFTGSRPSRFFLVLETQISTKNQFTEGR